MAKQSTDKFIARTGAVATRFRKQRPMRAGSLLVTLLGDAIAPRGGTIALASLIELGQLFGLPERLVRTSIGRLANEDWVASRKTGRASFYSLTANGRARFAEATQRIYSPPPASWNGQWTLVIIPPALKQARDELRDELSWMGFGELAPGVLAHPFHTEESIRPRLAELESTGQLIVVQSAVVAQASDVQLVKLGWNFGELSRRYRRFIATFAPANEALPASGAPLANGETSFTLRTLLLHEYRKIHLRDPLLPASLLPKDWAGADALELCRALYSKVFAASEAYLSATARTLDGMLPAASEEIYKRFGGLPR